MAIENSTLELEHDAVAAIRQALLIGLGSFGEIEKVRNGIELAKLGGHEIPDDVIPLHPTGASDTVSLFANALRYLG